MPSKKEINRAIEESAWMGQPLGLQNMHAVSQEFGGGIAAPTVDYSRPAPELTEKQWTEMTAAYNKMVGFKPKQSSWPSTAPISANEEENKRRRLVNPNAPQGL